MKEGALTPQARPARGLRTLLARLEHGRLNQRNLTFETYS
jgi:hypothetical protein